jgi:hypothetical protein
MSFLVYFFVLLVAATSVLFGLDWMQAPLQAPPAPGRTIQTVAPAPTPAAAAAQPAALAQPARTAAASARPAESFGAAPAASQPADDVKAEASEPKLAPLCDVDACERAYRTFTATDCTYKPSYGPRRLCTKGRRPAAQLASGEARAQASCNVSACASAYSSFDAATCTYQSYYGGRRLCTK